jgi:hypothetical protein
MFRDLTAHQFIFLDLAKGMARWQDPYFPLVELVFDGGSRRFVAFCISTMSN